MSHEKADYRNLWVTESTYKRLIEIRAGLDKREARNANDIIIELIRFWKKNRKNMKR